MSDGSDAEMPLHERASALVARVADLVLLVLTTTEVALGYEELCSRVVALVKDHGERFGVTTDSAARDTFDAIELFASLGYVEATPHTPERETIPLTDRGDRAATALVAGLDADQQAALDSPTDQH